MKLIVAILFGLFMLGAHFVVMAEDRTFAKKDGTFVENVIIENVSTPLHIDNLPNNIEVSCYTLIQKAGSHEFQKVHMPPDSCLIVTEKSGKLITVKPMKVGSKVELELPDGTYLFTLRIETLTPTFSGGQRRTLKQQTTKEIWIYENMQQVEIGVISD